MAKTFPCAAVLPRFTYDPETGLIFSEFGRRVGTVDTDGYIRVAFKFSSKQVRFRAHHLAFLAMQGAWPSLDVDHINGNRQDNRWANLREADRTTNAENKRHANRGSTSNLLGVSFAKDTGRWAAQIQVKGKNKNLGRRFPTPEAAHEAYLQAKRQFHAGCTI